MMLLYRLTTEGLLQALSITFDRNYRSLSIIIDRTAACTDLPIVTKTVVLAKKVTLMSLFHEKTIIKTTSTGKDK